MIVVPAVEFLTNKSIIRNSILVACHAEFDFYKKIIVYHSVEIGSARPTETAGEAEIGKMVPVFVIAWSLRSDSSEI